MWLTNCITMMGAGVPFEVKPSPTPMQEKPALDRESFQQLLEAAYVLQQHNDESRAPSARAEPSVRSDYSQVLSEVVEVQSLIYGPELDLHSAATLIATRALKFTRADGAAVGVVKDDELIYKSATGSAADDSGMPVPVASCLSAHCFTSGQTIHSLDTLKDRRIPSDLCRENHVQSLIAAPASYEGKVAGVLELRFTEKNAFQEEDVRTCQLMAGLLAQAIARSAELEWKQALAAERATMIETLAKIKPQLERMAVEPASPVVEPPADPAREPVAVTCRSCGHLLEKEESYCGICGTPRPSESARSRDLQSKWASLWHLKQASQIRNVEPSDEAPEDPAEAVPPADLEASEEAIPESASTDALTIDHDPQTVRILPAAGESAEAAAPAAVAGSPWTSASRARHWLESFNTPRKRLWLSRHRANLYLATAAVLLFAVITGWGSHPGQVSGNSANGRNLKNPPPPQLSLFEKTLVGLGLAVPPPAPSYKGNPNVTVWEDERTALYYCPGADLYGKTEKGKFSAQRDAQQDQFEPAFRRPCE